MENEVYHSNGHSNHQHHSPIPPPHPTPTHHTRRDLCAALAACHRWRALCLTEALWQPTVQCLWRAWHGKAQIEAHLRQAHGRPFLHPDAPPPVPAPEGQGWSRGRAVLAYRGRCIAESGLLLVGPRWPERYWIKCVWVWVCMWREKPDAPPPSHLRHHYLYTQHRGAGPAGRLGALLRRGAHGVPNVEQPDGAPDDPAAGRLGYELVNRNGVQGTPHASTPITNHI